MTDPTALDLKDGQIYRWRYREGFAGSYWCRSQIAIVKNGRLYDTYWSDESRPVSFDQVDLTFLCDQSWAEIGKWEIPYYDSSDVADTRHSNSSRASIYLRPGAARSEAAILAAIEACEEDANSQIRIAQWRLERLKDQRDLLAAGKLDEVSL